MAAKKYVQSNTLYLAGSGVIVGATSIALTSLTDIYGNAITSISSFGDKGYITLEPDTTNEEAATFTGVTANANGTVTLTGVSTVLAQSPYTETSGLVRAHSGGTKVVITDNVAFWDSFTNKNNNETIAGLWIAPDPVANQGVATKAYVLATVNGGTVTFDQEVVTGTAGEALTAGQVVYLKNDGLWYKASSATSATCLDVQLGIVQANALISANCSVLVSGLDKTLTGLSTGSTYYLSTAGALSTSAGTVSVDIGEAVASNRLMFKPFFASALNVANAPSLITNLSKFAGTGVDGALAITSGVTTIDLGSARVVTKNYTSISITGTASLAFSNPNTAGSIVFIKSQGNVTITSATVPAIDCRGVGAAGTTGSASGTSGTSGTSGIVPLPINATGLTGGGGGGQILSGTAGTAGSPVAPTLNTTFGLVTRWVPILIGAGGGGGGAGSNTSTGGTGGAGGGALVIYCGGSYNVTSTLSAAGADGGTAISTPTPNEGGGGGGGGGGGSIIVLYNTLTANSGTYAVNGGAPGNGSTGNGANIAGGGGGGGGSNSTGAPGIAGSTATVGPRGGTGGAGISLVTANTEFF